MPRKKAELVTQEAVIREMRSAKCSFAQIGEELGIAESAVFAIYRQMMAESPLSAVQTDEHRLESLELIDTAQYHLMQIALAEKTSQRSRIEAWNAIKGWEERRSKLLGLDAPTRHEVLTINAIDAQIAALEAEIDTRARMVPAEVIDAELVVDHPDPGGTQPGQHPGGAEAAETSPTEGSDGRQGEAGLPPVGDEVSVTGRFS